MTYINHFGEQSQDYLQFRPDYPQTLYDYIFTLVAGHNLAWDVGTGNGQAAIKLAAYFDEVIATDINQAQLNVAKQKANIHYRCEPSEKTSIAAGSVDLITIAQALHWFNFEKFYAEVKRVAKPSGIIAAWSYSLGKIDPALNKIIRKFYDEVLGDTYWPKERRYIDAEYETIPFPFQKIKTPNFIIEKEFNLAQLMGYLNTWSAVKEYQKIKHDNPLQQLAPELQKAWGDPHTMKKIHWPIHLLIAKVFNEENKS